jgi:hypothetical protein
MVEYHVNSLSLFQDRMSTTEFGGNLSVRLKEGEQPILSFSHDECIYKQYLLTKKAWTLPSGENKMVPKDEGQGVMISALQSREFGFGLPITEEQIRRVNVARMGQHYKDVDAAKKYKGTTEKQKLPSLSNSSMVHLTKDIGIMREWCYNWMIVTML